MASEENLQVFHRLFGIVFPLRLLGDIVDSSNPASEFVVGNCMGCGSLVRVPVKTKPSVNVRCPRCGETYQLAAFLDNHIPALEIVEDQDLKWTGSGSEQSVDVGEKYQPVTEKDNGRFVVPNYVTKAAVKPSRRRRRSSGVSERGHSEDRKAVAQSRRSRDSSIRSGRSRGHKKRHPLVELMMIFLGGCMSIPVAQLMVWWILGLDPLGVAADVARVIPIVVPADLRESGVIKEPSRQSFSKSLLDKDT